MLSVTHSFTHSVSQSVAGWVKYQAVIGGQISICFDGSVITRSSLQSCRGRMCNRRLPSMSPIRHMSKSDRLSSAPIQPSSSRGIDWH